MINLYINREKKRMKKNLISNNKNKNKNILKDEIYFNDVGIIYYYCSTII